MNKRRRKKALKKWLGGKPLTGKERAAVDREVRPWMIPAARIFRRWAKGAVRRV